MTGPNPTTSTRTETAPDERFTVRDPGQIVTTLTKLATDEIPVTCSYGPEGDVLHTRVLAVSSDRRTVFLEMTGDDAVDATVVAGPVSCQAALANIRVEFVLEPVVGRLHYSKVFAAPAPPFLIRVQRREYYRMNMDGIDGLSCELALPRTDRSDPLVDVRVVDLSGGGMAVVLPNGPWALRLHVELRECLLVLGDMGALQARAMVRNLVKLTGADGKPFVRMGCEFLGLRDGEIALLQRFVGQVQRRQREQQAADEAAAAGRSGR